MSKSVICGHSNNNNSKALYLKVFIFVDTTNRFTIFKTYFEIQENKEENVVENSHC